MAPAVREPCKEAPGLAPQIPARVVAERAGLDPDRVVQVLFELHQAGLVNFYRAGGHSPNTSFVICPEKD